MTAERAYVDTEREPLREVRPLAPPIWQTLHWSSIVGGWLIGFGIFMFLTMLGAGLGLSTFNAGTAAATGSVPAAQAGTNSMIWAGISAIIAYFFGAFAAARIVQTTERDRGAGNGVMVFLLSLPFAVLFVALGASGMLGGLGGLAGGAASSGVRPPTAGSFTPSDVATAASAVRNAAWGGVIAFIIGLIVSAIGGFVGAQPMSYAEREVVRHR